jgi:hypothetical protein
MYEWLSTGFWIGYWIYWPLTDRNYKKLRQSQEITHSKYHCNYSTHKAFSVFTKRFPATQFNSGDPSASVLTEPTKSFRHRLPYNSPFLLLSSSLQPVARTNRKRSSSILLQLFPWECVLFAEVLPTTAACTCLLKLCCLEADVVSLPASRPLPSNGSTHYNI